MPGTLLVPVRLDALFLPEPRTVAGPALDFAALPFFDGERDVHPGTPYLSSAVAAPPFEERQVRLEAGIHLHWSLPDALTRGAGGAFPAVPDRWLVTRSGGGAGSAAWVVESDYLAAAGSAGAADAVALPVAPARPGDPPFRFLGRRVPWAAWSAGEAAAGEGERLESPLTAVGYGDPTFAALYAACRGVFGMCDEAPDGGTGLRYEVLGWYADAARDPLQRLRGDVGADAGEEALLSAMRNRLGWSLEGADTLPERICCFARLELRAPFLATASGSVAVGLGNTGTEALSAYLADRVAPANRAIVEQLLEAAQMGVRLGQGAPADAPARFIQARHEKGFTASDAGSLWTVAPQSTAGAAAADDAAEQAKLTLPAPLADALNAVNALQDAYDRATDRVRALRRQLFADWHRYLAAARPAGGPDELPDPDEVRDFLERRSLPALEAARAATGVLTLLTGEDGRGFAGAESPRDGSIAARLAAALGELARAVDAFNASPATVAAKTRYVISRGPAPRFWRSNDPVVLVTGEETRATPRHGQDGSGEEDGLLPCALLAGPAAPPSTDPDAIRAALDALAAADPGRPGFDEGDGRPWNPLLLEWMVEFFPARAAGTPDPAGSGYAPDAVTAAFELPDAAVDLRPRAVELARGANVYRGSSVLTPHPAVQMERVLEGALARLVWPRLARGFAERGETPEETPAEREVLARRAAWDAWTATLEPPLPPLPADDGRDPGALVDQWLRGAWEPASAWMLAQGGGAPALGAASGGGRAESLDGFMDGYAARLGGRLAARSGDSLAVLAAERAELAALKGEAQLVVLRAARAHLAETPVLAQALGGFHEALLMLHHDVQLPVDDPLGFADDRSFVERVRAAVGSEGRSGPRPSSDFNPVRAGALDLVRLRLVDTFGQLRELAWDRVVAAEPLAPLDARFPAFLRPRLAQPARLDLRWLAADRDEQEMNDHPATRPVCGWVVANFLDAALMVYDAEGAALGSLTGATDDPWRPATGTDGRPTLDGIASPTLRRVVRSLLARQRASQEAGEETTFLDRLLERVETALERIAPEAAVHPASQALLFGRPLAVVRASLQLEVEGAPAMHQGWNALRRDLRRAARDTHGFESVRFPLRVGEHGRFDDGVVGYWVDGAAEEHDFPLDRMFLPQRGPPDDGYFGEGGLLPDAFGPAVRGDALTLCLLLDPRALVHATCGVLPAKAIGVPADQYLPALRAIEVAFLTAPVLTDRGALRISLPDEPGFAWSWLAREGGRWTERAAHGVLGRSELLAAFGDRGPALWDRLLSRGWLRLQAGERAEVVAANLRTETTLGDDLEDAVPAVEALLATTQIEPFRIDAALVAPQELREGWLQLRPVSYAPSAAEP